jgi:DNA-binding IscR family transcriptional regulator
MENKRSIAKAAQITGINPSTAKVIARKLKKNGRVSSKPSRRSSTIEDKTL